MWRRWYTPQNFFLAFIDELEKQLLIKKTVDVNKKQQKQKNIFTMLHFLKKKKKTPGDIIILHQCIKNLNVMIYSFWDIECDRMKLVIYGHFLPFLYPPKNSKTEHFEKNEKIAADIIIILHMWTKFTIIQFMVPEIQIETGKTFLGQFLPFYPLNNSQN